MPVFTPPVQDLQFLELQVLSIAFLPWAVSPGVVSSQVVQFRCVHFAGRQGDALFSLVCRCSWPI